MNANYASIIVPLDGSPLAEHALPFAIAIAQRDGSRVALVHVHDEGVVLAGANAPVMDGAWEDDQAAEMGGAIRAMADKLANDTGVAVTAVTLRGAAAPSLVQYANAHAADLIVMTTHGRSGFSHAWFGSVAERVIHAATTPVLVVRAGEHVQAKVAEPLFGHVLLPIDREQSGAEAMQHALTLGMHGQTTYTLLTIVSALPILPPPYPYAPFVGDPEFETRGADTAALLERIAVPARTAGDATEARVVTSEQTAPAILEVAKSTIDLIVMPTHPRGSFSRALLGSVVDKVMRGATVPLLLFRASHAADESSAAALQQPFAGLG